MIGGKIITSMASLLIINIGFLVPKAAAQSDKYSKMAPVAAGARKFPNEML